MEGLNLGITFKSYYSTVYSILNDEVMEVNNNEGSNEDKNSLHIFISIKNDYSI